MFRCRPVVVTVAMLQVTVTVTKSFIEYIKSQPVIFELYGHYQPTRITSATADDLATCQPSVCAPHYTFTQHTHARSSLTDCEWSPFCRSAWFEEITRIRLTSFRMCVTLDANYHAVEDSVDFTCKLTPISRWLSDGTVAGFQFGPSCQGLFTIHKFKWIELMWTSRLSYAKSPASAL